MSLLRKKAKVSIILPNYNSSTTIKKTISSIVNQTYKNWELIIVDDNSDKVTKNILLLEMCHEKKNELMVILLDLERTGQCKLG